ncbi:MAG TPA: His/Gly/Thr/Pro-type tRNA ligase C-terminal domain-containing protein [Candidatus Paceibacterota bacterium]|nr:His/Gly/Thr/Pro-type tRNA ligase C-terminal domain-containing protein [Candidatus Paceibacterota bacterium]
MSTSRTSPISFLKHASEVASFYGFRPMREIERDHMRHIEAKVGNRRTQGVYSFQSAALLGAMRAAARPQDPILGFYATPAPSHVPGGMSPRDVGEFGLQVIGTPESVGEIVLLKTITMVATEWGSEVERVRVNALGDRDSQQRFGRELGSYLRRNLDQFEEAARKGVMDDPFSVYRLHSPEITALLEGGPRPMHFLSEKSRVHFRSVLEHLEQLGIPYQLDDLLGGDERGPHIAFALDFKEDDATIVGALGGRYDEYLKRESHRKDSTGVGASIFFRKKGVSKQNFATVAPAIKPKIYFAQLGLRAKLQGLAVVDMLRAAHVPVLQSFDASRLSMQLSAAAELGVPYLLIMGQREALDGTVIVRSTRNSSQHIISVNEVPRFLRTLR